MERRRFDFTKEDLTQNGKEIKFTNTEGDTLVLFFSTATKVFLIEFNAKIIRNRKRFTDICAELKGLIGNSFTEVTN